MKTSSVIRKTKQLFVLLFLFSVGTNTINAQNKTKPSEKQTSTQIKTGNNQNEITTKKTKTKITKKQKESFLFNNNFIPTNIKEVSLPKASKALITYEGFESSVPPTGWIHYQQTGSNSWTQTTARFNSGTNSAFFDDFNGDNTVWLISNPINSDLYSSKFVSYYENVNWRSYADKHIFAYSNNYTGSGDPSTATWNTINNTIGTEDTWVQKTFDISLLSGTTYFAFVYIGNYASEWYIDDYRISGDLIATGSNTITTGTTSEPLTIPSITDTQAESFINFDFNIKDDGSNNAADALNTKFNQIQIDQGTGNDVADWTQAISGATLYDGTTTINGTVNTSNITFSAIPDASSGDFGFIADNTNKTYSLKIWLKTTLGGTLPATIDGLNLVFNVTAGSFSLEGTSSGFASGESENSGATNNEITVTATQLRFTQQPATTATVGVALSTQPIVSATDTNGNIDLNVTSSVSLANTGGLSMSGNTMNFVAGIANFGTPNTFNFTSGNAYVLLSASSGSLNTIIPSIEIAVDIVGCTLFSENFSSYSNSSDLTTDGVDWDYLEITNSVNDWGINSNYMTIYNGGSSDAYKNNNDAEQIAYYATTIDASKFKDISITFKWKCNGQTDKDYGTIVWCTGDPTAASNWSIAEPTKHTGKSSFTTTTKDISVCDGQQFYIGFRWINDGSTANNPPFAVDDIVISGFPKFDYNFSYRQDTYKEITGTVLTSFINDGENISLPAGFDFEYDGTPVTSVRANINGWMQIGNTHVANEETNSLLSTALTPFLAPFWDNLTSDTQTRIIYNTSGTSPTRVFTIEWKDVLWGTERENFQIKLYESSSVIEFWYGTMNTNASGSTSIGINNNGDCLNKMISVTPGATPSPSYSAENSTINSATYLNSGLVYIFNPLQMQKYASWEAATVCIGQSDFNQRDETWLQNTTPGANNNAVSSKGVLAVGAQQDPGPWNSSLGWYAPKSVGRILLWNSMPTSDGTNADVVIGKTSFTDETLGCTDVLMNNCEGIAFTPDGEKLIVSDGGNNRVLIWNTIPTSNGQPADVVIGQPNMTSGGSGCSATQLYYPTGITVLPNGKLLISDMGNNRVLIYNSVPTSNNAAADVIIGQSNFTSNASGTGQNKLSGAWYSSYSPDGKLVIGDTGNNRILIYNDVPTTNGASADIVIGQNDFTATTSGVSSSKFHSPIGVTVSPEGKLAVGDFQNSRVLIFDRLPTNNGARANVVLGQSNFSESWCYSDGLKQIDNAYYNSYLPTNKNMFTVYGITFDLNGRFITSSKYMHRAMLYGKIPTETNDLELSISSDAIDVCIFSDVKYTVNITNNSGDPASSIVVNAQLPVGFIATKYNTSLGTYNQKSGYWSIPYIAVGETVTLTFEGEVQPDLSGNNNVIAYANIIASKQADTDFSNNGDNQIVAVRTYYAPTSTDIADRYIKRNSHTVPVIDFTVDDLDGLADITSYTCSSTNTTLIPINYSNNLLFTGTAPDKTLDIYPTTDKFGYSDMQLIITDSHGCYKEYDFKIAVGNIWEGDVVAAPTDWDTKENWSSGNVPSEIIEAIIPSSPIGGYFPIISTNDAKCEDFLIEPKAGVTLSDTKTLHIYGDMLIESDATGTGSFVDLNTSAGQVTTDAKVTVERYITPNAWHYLSSPLTGVSNKVLTENVCGSHYNGNVLDYNENFTSDMDGDGDIDWFDGWEWPWYYNHNNAPLVSGNGYAYYTFSGSCSKTIAFTTTGSNSLTSGDISYSATNQDVSYAPTGFGPHHGWNLIGNPYPSGVDAIKFIETNGTLGTGVIDNAIYLWDENGFTGFDLEGKEYATFNTLGTTGPGDGSGSVSPDKYISSGQAFYVHRTNTDIAGSDITFDNSMREQENSSFFKNYNTPVPKVKISIKNEQNMFNEIIVALKDDATDQRDVAYDAFKMEGNKQLSLYSKIGTDNFTIQALKSLKENESKSVTIGFNAGTAGNYEFSILLLEYIPENTFVILEDLYNNISIDLSKIKQYSFSTEAGRFDDRFILHFNKNNAPIVMQTISDITTNEDEEFNFTIPTNTFSDSDQGDELTINAKSNDDSELPKWLKYKNNLASFTGAPKNKDVGNYTVKIIATDNFGFKAETTFTISVNNINDAPFVALEISDIKIGVGQELNFKVAEETFNDIDNGDKLTLSAKLEDGNPLPAWLQFSSKTSTFTGVPNDDNIGSYPITLFATDNSGAVAKTDFVIYVSDATTTENIDTEDISIFPNPSNGTFTITNKLSSNYEICVSNVTGQEIYRHRSLQHNSTIDLTNQTEGLYFIKIVIEDRTINTSAIIKK